MTQDSPDSTPKPADGKPAELIRQAILLFRDKRAEAVALARRALEAAEAAGDKVAMSKALNIIAESDRIEGRFDEARDGAVRAAELAHKAGDQKAEADAVKTLGALDWHRGEFDLAIERYREVLRLRELLGDDHGTAAACSDLSLMFWEKGDLAQAMDFQQRSLALREKLGDKFGVGESYLNLGLVYLDLGDWDKALESYFRALAEHEIARNQANMALCYNNIGEVYLKRGKLDRARFHLVKALDSADRAKAPWIRAEILGNLGEAAFAAGDYGRARDYYEQHHRLCRDAEDREELAETLRRMAELDLAQDDRDGARARLDEALELCSQMGARREEGNARRVLGELLAAGGDVDGAGAEFDSSIAILRSLGKNYELGRALFAHGRLLASTGQDGEGPLNEALGIFRNLGITGRAAEVEQLLGRGAAAGQVDLIQRLTELACAGRRTAEFCAEALELLTAKLPASGAVVFLRDGTVYRHGAAGDAGPEAGGTNLPLETCGRRVGTLVLNSDVATEQLGTVAGLMALGLVQTRAAPAPAAEPPDQRFPGIIGADTTMRDVFETIERVAGTKASVLILGESGTGKEIVAQTLHRLSDRNEMPFIAVNCAAIPETLLESELFGIEKGTATGVAGRPGKFETAQGGTVFLDEIGDMSLALQAKMLRVLQEKTYERVGGRRPVAADVRVVAATSRDLEAAMADGRFRRDLYYRLNVITLNLPPLRDRRQDIPALVAHFVERFAREYSKPLTGTTEDCLARLMAQDWPGNVRELENAIERGVILARGELVTADDLPAGLKPAPARQRQWQEVRRRAKDAAAAPVERQAIVTALEQNRWVVKRTAEKLGISRVQLWRLMKKYGISRPGSTPSS